jgi:hypothetical protein
MRPFWQLAGAHESEGAGRVQPAASSSNKHFMRGTYGRAARHWTPTEVLIATSCSPRGSVVSDRRWPLVSIKR